MTCQSAVDRWPACNRIRSLTGSGKEHMPLFDLDYMAHVPGEKSLGGKERWMPSALTLTMSGDADKRHGTYIASLLQGVIMDRIDPAYARKLHESSIHPYSQFVEEEDGKIQWHIHALTNEAETEILGPLMEPSFTEVELLHRQETLLIKERFQKSVSYEELIQGYYLGDCGRNINLQIRSPMAFKQNGRYCIFPTARLIFQSLMLRFDACTPDSTIFTPELLGEFENLTEIADYRLRSVRFSMEGVRIPSFMGNLRIRVQGPQQMANVAWMLAKFGEYSGIGIKTGMGMGAVQIRENTARREYRTDRKEERING